LFKSADLGKLAGASRGGLSRLAEVPRTVDRPGKVGAGVACHLGGSAAKIDKGTTKTASNPPRNNKGTKHIGEEIIHN